jgi:hypothetical protein
LNRALSVKPTIRKGKRISQIIGKNISKRIAIGQQSTNSKHQRTTARKVRIDFLLLLFANTWPKIESCFFD